jgi:hypothetical protein
MPLTPFRSLRMLFIAASLLVAQWVLAQHEVQIEAHAAHTACEWCLTHAPLSGGSTASAAPVPVAKPVTAIAEVRISPFAGITLPACASRAPPAALRV